MIVGTVSSLYIYPVNAMGAQRPDSVQVSPERGFPLDRAFALAHYDGDSRRESTEPLSSSEFHTLTADHRLAGIRTRCAATEVNRASAVRDLPIPRLIKRFHGHTDFGVSAAVTTGGLLEPGMTVSVSARADGEPGR